MCNFTSIRFITEKNRITLQWACLAHVVTNLDYQRLVRRLEDDVAPGPRGGLGVLLGIVAVLQQDILQELVV